jgi:hypothetical protein
LAASGFKLGIGTVPPDQQVGRAPHVEFRNKRGSWFGSGRLFLWAIECFRCLYLIERGTLRLSAPEGVPRPGAICARYSS